MKRRIRWLVAGAVVLPLLLAGGPAAAKKVGRFDAPILTCVGATQHTIFLEVCAGPTGAPAGFSVQWVRHADYPDLTCGVSGQDALWPDSSGADLCKGSFSGVPWCSIYNLEPNAYVTIEIGNLNDAECGVGMDNCGAAELECGTEYVFRAFAHATSSMFRSDFSANACCSTDPCAIEACVHTQGYWKTHPCDWPLPFVPGDNGTALPDQCALTSNPNQQCAADTVNAILIGANPYNQADLLCSLDQPGQGNALRILAHQLIAAELNVLSGADPTPIAATLAEAHSLIGGLNILTDVVPPGGKENTLGPAMTAAAGILDLYNNGQGGVGHCP